MIGRIPETPLESAEQALADLRECRALDLRAFEGREYTFECKDVIGRYDSAIADWVQIVEARRAEATA